MKHNAPVSERRKLLEKYKGLCFLDSTTYKITTIDSESEALYWRKRMRGDGPNNYSGWYLNGVDEDGEDNIFHIDEDICKSISIQKQGDGIEVVNKTVDDEDDNEVEVGSDSE